jgi:predicted dehydrogenase
MARLRTAVIGVGHLGKEHARVLAGFPEVDLVGIADVNSDQARLVAERCGTKAFPHHQPLLDVVDAATIVVPTIQHYSVAGDFVRRGISVLVEKPLAESLQRAQILVDLAERHAALLQVGHIERFNPAYEEAKRFDFKPRFIDCERLGPFSGRSTDIGVVFDLMIHDLDLLLDFVGCPVRSVEAVGRTVYGRNEDEAIARLVFENGCEAHLSSSRAAATPRRHMRIWGDEGYLGIDYGNRTVSLIEGRDVPHGLWREIRGASPARLRGISEDMLGPRLRRVRPERSDGDQLTRELRDFVRSVSTGVRPRVDGMAGRDAVALAIRIVDQLDYRSASAIRGLTVPWFRSSSGDAAA